jgi:hypothetical protein
MKITLKHFRPIFLPIVTLTAFIFIFLASCEKSKREVDDSINQARRIDKASVSNAKPAEYVNAEREAYIKKKFSTPTSKVSGIEYLSKVTNAGAPCGPSQPGCCRTFEESYSILHDERWVDCTVQQDMEVIYHWTVYETICTQPGSPEINYTFTADPGFGQSYTGTALLLEQHFEVINYFTGIEPKCYMVKTFQVTVQMPRLVYEFAQSTVNTVTGTSACLGTPQTISQTIPLTIAFCGYLARGYVDAMNTPPGTVLVSTHCALCAPVIHGQCPSSGLFEYRIEGTQSAYNHLPFTASTNLFSIPPNIPNQNYEYRLTLFYSNCSSTPLTGTFHVN